MLEPQRNASPTGRAEVHSQIYRARWALMVAAGLGILGFAVVMLDRNVRTVYWLEVEKVLSPSSSHAPILTSPSRNSLAETAMVPDGSSPGTSRQTPDTDQQLYQIKAVQNLLIVLALITGLITILMISAGIFLVTASRQGAGAGSGTAQPPSPQDGSTLQVGQLRARWRISDL